MNHLLLNPSNIYVFSEQNEMSSAEYQLLTDVINNLKTQIAQQDNINNQNFNDVNLAINKNSNLISQLEKTASNPNENLLINPRGIINQADESDGLLDRAQYFRDGWRSIGVSEIYAENGGFRIESGNIVQFVENNFEIGTKLKGSINIVEGDFSLHVYQNGESSNGTGYYEIKNNDPIIFRLDGVGIFEKPCLVVCQDKDEKPIYREKTYDQELDRCKRFYQKYFYFNLLTISEQSNNRVDKSMIFEKDMISYPSISFEEFEKKGFTHYNINVNKNSLKIDAVKSANEDAMLKIKNLVLDARM